MQTTGCYFVTDMHGKTDRFEKLFGAIETGRPAAVFIGGDILPSGAAFYSSSRSNPGTFIREVILSGFEKLREKLGDEYPEIFVILGNDDAKIEEPAMLGSDLWNYMNLRTVLFGKYSVSGYSYVPPTPFRLKDWEKYDVSRFVDPGCISPEEGIRTVSAEPAESRYGTIKKDLEVLTDSMDMSNAVFLFHSPPYQTSLDRAALDGKSIDYTPLDPNVGSIAIRKFIEEKQPLLTLHGHIHESTRLTGSWKDKIGRTICFNAAHHGRELSLIRFDLGNPENAERLLL